MTRTLGIVAVLAAVNAGVLAAGQAQDDYARLLGAQEAALEGKGSLAAIEFAGEALAAAKRNIDKKELLAILCEKACDYGMKDSSGYATAIEAMRLLAANAPARRADAQERLGKALAASFRSGADTKQGAEALELLTAAAARQEAAGQSALAAGNYQEAAALARQLPSPRAAQLEAAARKASARGEAQKAQAQLQARLTNNPKDTGARMELIAMYVGVLDNPKAAAALVNGDVDPATGANVPLAGKAVEGLDEKAAFELASWYLRLAETASGANKAALLSRSQVCGKRFLGLHTANDAKAAQARALLEKASEPVAAAGEWLTSFPEAAKLAKASNKLVLADFTGTDWCVWCIRLKKEVFDTPEFKAWAGRNVVLLELDFPQHKPQPADLKAANEALMKKYNIEGFPTVLFLKPDGTVAGTSGYMKGGPSAWIAAAQKILDAAK